MNYLEEKYATVDFREEVPCVHITWHGYANTAQSQKALNSVIDAMVDKQVFSVIADVREMKVISPEMQKWNYEVWMPRAIKAGYNVLALVQSTDFFNQVSVNNIIDEYEKEYGKEFRVNVVKSVEEAEKWIQSLN